METVVLIIHLLVCICLIGLVLLQRSEGGALGMGGGGSGSLMSGRGAADALAKMTSVAGGFFLVTSLGLSIISNMGSGSGSVFDSMPQGGAPAAVAPSVVTPEEPAPTTPDPTESSAPQAAETQLASATVPVGAQPTTISDGGQPRAAPLSAPATSRQATVPTSTPSRQATTPTSTPARSTQATTVPASQPTRAPVIPNSSGSSVSGISLDDDPSAAESIEIAPVGVQPVRRERAGPDQ